MAKPRRARRVKKTKTKRQKPRRQRGGSIPWVVDVKKGYEVTRDMIKAVQKPIDWKAAKRDVSRYKREYRAYKAQGGSKGYSKWAVDKGYAAKSSCCIQ